MQLSLHNEAQSPLFLSVSGPAYMADEENYEVFNTRIFFYTPFNISANLFKK